MAHYTVNHCCGHSREVQLFGPGKERDRKLDWMAGQDCPQCWGQKQRAAEALKPITMSISTNGLDHDSAGQILAEVVLSGGTQPRKDEIKALGYFWGEVRGGVLNFLSTKSPDKAWSKSVRLLDLADPGSALWQQLKADAQALGITKLDTKISEIDLEMARQSIAKQHAAQEASQAKQAAIAALPKPPRPACHPRAQHPDGEWNGKYYGKPGRWNYYVSNVNYTLTDAEYAECMAYRKAMEAYNAQVAAHK